MILVVPIHEVLQDGTTLPDVELIPNFVRIDDSWDAAIGIDIEVPLLLLLVFKELDCADLAHEIRQDCRDLRLPAIVYEFVRCTPNPVLLAR